MCSACSTDGLGPTEYQPSGKCAGGIQCIILRQLGQTIILPIVIMLRPNKGADAFEKCCTRCWQLRIIFCDTCHQTKHQWVAVKIFEAVVGEVIENVVSINIRILRDEKRPGIAAVERHQSQNAWLVGVKLAQNRRAAPLPFPRSAGKHKRR
ncbi:hypothetical protein HMPREF2939_06745 [Achromobacter xylosoxidans]|nr:hypothetical protein HMPREF2939_06745 [Achromobacter xylosoxidans]